MTTGLDSVAKAMLIRYASARTRSLNMFFNRNFEEFTEEQRAEWRDLHSEVCTLERQMIEAGHAMAREAAE